MYMPQTGARLPWLCSLMKNRETKFSLFSYGPAIKFILNLKFFVSILLGGAILLLVFIISYQGVESSH